MQPIIHTPQNTSTEFNFIIICIIIMIGFSLGWYIYGLILAKRKAEDKLYWRKSWDELREFRRSLRDNERSE